MFTSMKPIYNVTLYYNKYEERNMNTAHTLCVTNTMFRFPLGLGFAYNYRYAIPQNLVISDKVIQCQYH